MKLKRLIILPVIFTFLLFSGVAPVSAKTAEEIQKEIDAKTAELNGLQSNLSKAQKDLAYYTNQKNSAATEFEKIDAEIKEIEAQIEYNNLKLQELEQSKELKELEKEEREKVQDSYVFSSYMNWKMNSFTDVIFGSNSDFVKTATYQSAATEDENTGIKGISTEIDTLNNDISSYTEEKTNLENQTKDLESRKTELSAQLAVLNSSINSTNSNVAGVKSQIGSLQSAISQLTEQQKAIQAADNLLTGGATNGGTNPVQSGELYFSGRGRDIKQGHGVGMSQYGAQGMASKGWDFAKILTFYYTGVSVADYAANSQISISYCSKSPNYDTPPCDAGSSQITKRIGLNDYLGGLGEMPESWPIEARKAQMVAARTYALRATNNGSASTPICLTTACQVSYLRSGGTDADFMDNGDYQIAVDTNNKVILYGGSLISAVYSSDNNQGYGTANNDTVWSNFSGVGTPYAYLRNVNDTPYATATSYTNWTWRTNSYTYTEITQMLNYSAANYTTGGAQSFIQGIKNSTGNVTSLTFIRDGSNRVKQVKFTGTNGSGTMSGWLFKAIWNNWIANVKPSGQTDYIYSLTWFMLQG